jgi:hypothetical protein
METSGYPPREIPQHELILILPGAVIAVEVDSGLPKSVVLKKVVEEGHNRVRTLTVHMSLVNQEIHLPRNTLTMDPKQPTLPWSKEVNGSGL